jgi:hypothetical protein
MSEEWQINEARIKLRLVRYLLVLADKRGMTHGEKHHFIFTAISLLGEAQVLLNDKFHSVLTPNDSQELHEDQIPF